MAVFPSDQQLTDVEIDVWCTRIAADYNASNVTFEESTMAFYVFKGIVSNAEVKFNLDKQTGFIVIEEN